MSRHAACAPSGSGRTSLYDEITIKIIAELEAGRVPWVQPWGTAAAKAPLAMPKNAATGRFYSARRDRSWSAPMTARSRSDRTGCSWSGRG
jgi:N-terminal domain of anti-restriction factor ArdC